jgi:hypothetical protein
MALAIFDCQLLIDSGRSRKDAFQSTIGNQQSTIQVLEEALEEVLGGKQSIPWSEWRGRRACRRTQRRLQCRGRYWDFLA